MTGFSKQVVLAQIDTYIENAERKQLERHEELTQSRRDTNRRRDTSRRWLRKLITDYNKGDLTVQQFARDALKKSDRFRDEGIYAAAKENEPIPELSDSANVIRARKLRSVVEGYEGDVLSMTTMNRLGLYDLIKSSW